MCTTAALSSSVPILAVRSYDNAVYDIIYYCNYKIMIISLMAENNNNRTTNELYDLCKNGDLDHTEESVRKI